MSLEKTIIDLTSNTPSGGTCWIGDIPFTVWCCSDCWEWVFRGVYYFDPLDLSEAIEAFMQQTTEDSPLVAALSERPKVRPGLACRKARLAASRGRPIGLLPRPQRRPEAFPATR